MLVIKKDLSLVARVGFNSRTGEPVFDCEPSELAREAAGLVISVVGADMRPPQKFEFMRIRTPWSYRWSRTGGFIEATATWRGGDMVLEWERTVGGDGSQTPWNEAAKDRQASEWRLVRVRVD